MTDWTAIRKSLIGEKSKPLLPGRIKLPVLPLSVMKFCKKADDPKADPKDVAAIIETDSALTVDLLRYVNSSAHGMSHTVRSTQQAIAILGIQACKNYLLTSAIKRSMKGMQSRYVNLEEFWCANLERALFAREVAVMLDADHDLAFSGGMLQDFLLPVVTNGMYSEYQPFETLQREKLLGLVQFEQEKFHWDHAEAAAHVMLSWEFPDNLICCVLLHHRGLRLLKEDRFKKTAAAAVGLSALLPASLLQEPTGFAQLARLEQVWPDFDLLAIAKRVDARFADLSPVKVKRQTLLDRCQKMAALSH